MTDLPQRTISELLTRYQLEPSISDIFVEGSFDLDVVNVLLSQTKSAKKAYLIDTVKIPPEVREGYGLTSGKKQNIIALFRALQDAEGTFDNLGVVDKDVDHWFGSNDASNGIVWTRFAAMENYFLDPQLLFDVLVVSSKVKISNWEDFYDAFCFTLLQLYALRLADEDVELDLTWSDFPKFLNRKGDVITLNLLKYGSSLLQQSGKWADREKFWIAYEKWLAELSIDIRDCVRGHDYLSLASWVITNMGGIKAMASELVISRVWLLEVQRNRGWVDLPV